MLAADTDAAVWSGTVVMIAPPAGDDPHFFEAVEDFAIERFVTQADIEALDIAIFT